MIVAAGLGTRLRPLSELLPKPAMPVRGLPLVAYQLALLAHHGVSEVVINAHHLPERLQEAARRHCPAGLALHFSLEPELLDTGGAIRRVAGFLRESDPCLILGGDMLLDVDLAAFAERHRARGDAVTLLLRRDPRASEFGSIGIDAEGCVRRIARRFDLGGEREAGLYTWVNAVSPRALDALPERAAFGHLDHWIAPLLAAGARDVRGELVGAEACAWEPVGTPAEYLAANLRPRRLAYLDPEARARELGVRFCGDLILGVGATLGPGASLARAVVWDGERVPPAFRASDGVFAGGRFHPCGPPPGRGPAAPDPGTGVGAGGEGLAG
jgi:mannose-1-phosphate guanylyltransferase